MSTRVPDNTGATSTSSTIRVAPTNHHWWYGRQLSIYNHRLVDCIGVDSFKKPRFRFAQLIFNDVIELRIRAKTKKRMIPSSFVRYILPKKNYPFSDIFENYFNWAFSFFLAFACLVLFEVTFLLIFSSFYQNLFFLWNQQYHLSW